MVNVRRARGEADCEKGVSAERRRVARSLLAILGGGSVGGRVCGARGAGGR